MANLQDIKNISQIGTIKPWGKTTAPAGYVLCDGSEIGAPATGTVLIEGSDTGAGTLSAETAAKGICVAVLNNLKTHSRDLVLNEVSVAVAHANGHDGKIAVENKGWPGSVFVKELIFE